MAHFLNKQFFYLFCHNERFLCPSMTSMPSFFKIRREEEMATQVDTKLLIICLY